MRASMSAFMLSLGAVEEVCAGRCEHTRALSFLICLFRTYVRKCIGRDKYMSGTDAVWSSADK